MHVLRRRSRGTVGGAQGRRHAVLQAMSRRRAVVLTVMLVGVSTILSTKADSAETTPCTDFSGTAAADGARTATRPAGLEVLGEIEAAGPAAQAHVDSLGTSSGYAAAPYPGEVVNTSVF